MCVLGSRCQRVLCASPQWRWHLFQDNWELSPGKSSASLHEPRLEGVVGYIKIRPCPCGGPRISTPQHSSGPVWHTSEYTTKCSPGLETAHAYPQGRDACYAGGCRRRQSLALCQGSSPAVIGWCNGHSTSHTLRAVLPAAPNATPNSTTDQHAEMRP